MHRGSSLRRPQRYQGILNDHPGLVAISEFANQFMETKAGQKEMRELVRVADALIVLVGDFNTVRDLNFSQSADVEDEEGYGDEDVGQARWTCQAECDAETKPTVTTPADLAVTIAISEQERTSRRIKREHE